SFKWLKLKLKNPFLFGLFAAFSLTVLLNACFNVLVDPYFTRSSRLKGFNDGYHSYPLLNIRETYKLQKKKQAVASIIGTSNVFFGISNCGDFGYERISAYSASSEATTELAINILQKRKDVSKVFIEISRSEKKSFDPN